MKIKSLTNILFFIRPLLLVVFIQLSLPLQATDLEKVLPEFNQEQVDSLSQLKKYQYEIAAKPPVSFWQKIVWFLKKLLMRVFGDSYAAVSFRYVILTLVIVVIIFQLLRADMAGLFFKKHRAVAPYTDVSNKNLFKLNFDEEISKAIKNNSYTDVVRFYYLKALKSLHEKGYIEWKKTKTNSDFLCEIKDKKISDEFKKLSSWFEYIVYGDFILSGEQFEKVNKSFSEFIEQLNNNSHD